MDKLIESILTTKRCHNSKGEISFLAWLRQQLEGKEVTTLAEGCILVVTDPEAKTLFSCHTDTVHPLSESDGTHQKLFFDESFQHIFLEKGTGSCLGADDGAGIYIMLKMIAANVPGSYIFHRGEEKGGIGAHAVLKASETWLKGFNACIAFDRPNNDEVIITQGGTSCASDTYGAALAATLSKGNLRYKVSTRGVFTDSKVYRNVIRECINIGVGYANQHGPDEYQDWAHLQELTDACIAIKWEELPVTRIIPSEFSKSSYYDWSKNTPAFAGASKVSPLGSGHKAVAVGFEDDVGTYDIDLEGMEYHEIEDLTGDAMLSAAIVHLLMELDAERGRVTRLQTLLGLV